MRYHANKKVSRRHRCRRQQDPHQKQYVRGGIMTVNILKTKAMFLSSAQKQSQLPENAPNIRFGDDQI